MLTTMMGSAPITASPAFFNALQVSFWLAAGTSLIGLIISFRRSEQAR